MHFNCVLGAEGGGYCHVLVAEGGPVFGTVFVAVVAIGRGAVGVVDGSGGVLAEAALVLA